MDIGNKDRLAQQNLHTPQNTTNRMIPKLLLPPNLSDRNRLTCSHPDAIIVIAKPLNTSSASQRRVRTWYTKRPEKNIWNGGDHTSCHLPQPLRPDEIPKKRRHVHLLEVKYCEDTRPDPQLEASRLQHRDLCKSLQGAHVTLHSILLGVGGTTYTSHTLDHLTQLGLDPQRATKLANNCVVIVLLEVVCWLLMAVGIE